MRARMSVKLTPVARTRMRICPSPGTGSEDSRISKTSGSPYRGITACRMGVQATTRWAVHEPVGGWPAGGRVASRWAALEPPLRREQRQERLLRVQPILRLVEHDRRGRIHDLVG